MAHTRLTFRAQAREKILSGASQLADAVRVTLGPKSKSVLIGKKWGQAIVCNDGVTIAKAVDLPDPEEALGAQMMREAAERTGQAVGDGTTTATLLAHAILAEGIRNVAAGASAIDLKRGLDRGCKVAIDAIEAMSRPIRTRKEKAQIATISAHNDAALGERVADAMEKVGAEGVVSVEEAKGTETTLEVVEGMQVDRGWLSPYFITDAERAEAVLEDAVVLLTDRKLAAMDPLIPILEHVVKSAKGLLLMAEEVEGEALATLVVNKLRGTLRCVAVKTPGFGDRRRAMLEDLAVLTGAQLVSEDLGLKLEKLSPEVLGRVKRVVVRRETTTLIGGMGDRAAITGRQRQLREELKRTTSEYDREKLQERLAKLTGGVALIRVGASSETELKARREAFEDAISATKAALTGGVVPGAGLSLLRAIRAVETEEAKVPHGDEQTGLRILRAALEAPTRQLARNSGADDGVVVGRMREADGATGFDASTGKYVDLVEAGIIDPTRVVRSALENAVSVASVLLLTEAVLTELPERTKHAEVPEEV